MNTTKTKPFKLKPGHMLGLRTNAPDMRSHSGFLWPDVGGVATAPDWDPAPQCGRGLHFLPWGAGDASLLHAPEDPETHWLVISTPAASVVALGGKSKCQACAVVYCGPKEGALALLQAHAPAGTPVAYATVTGGDRATVTGGDGATVTGGDRATVTGGDEAAISTLYYDGQRGKYRRLLGYVGAGGLKPDVAYRVNGKGQFEAVAK